jgi:hypothetical protein
VFLYLFLTLTLFSACSSFLLFLSHSRSSFLRTLDYIFVSEESTFIQYAKVFPLLAQNEEKKKPSPKHEMKIIVNREKTSFCQKEEEIEKIDLLNQVLTSCQPSLSWPSDHFLLYSVLDLS